MTTQTRTQPPAISDWQEHLPDTMQLKSSILGLEEYPDFIKWLDADGMRLPAHLERTQVRSAKTDYGTYDGEDDWQGEDEDNEVVDDGLDISELISDLNEDDWQGEDEDNEVVDDGLDISELISDLNEVFAEYEEVFAMSDSTAPQDAGWSIANGEVLKCQTPIEVISILKSSTLTSSEWDTRRSSNLRCNIVLRKWYNLERSLLFRAYSSEGSLVGISQKALSEFHPFLSDIKHEIATACEILHKGIIKHLKDLLPSEGDFAFDFYLTKPGSKTKKRTAKLMGFHNTDEKLLFGETLPSVPEEEQQPEVRVIEDTDDVVDCGPAAFLKAGLPMELRDMSQLVSAAEAVDNSQGGSIQENVNDVIKMMQQTQ
eukprot:TRINITY_DN20060_c0_g1_i1.p1 TRINITY_DN20060_c0_g1~~TRINITY_DN20060_c0_g1_i1.p1  ORF type:complete len:372 (+),score=92.34 TRINITY_DN20060_c0_g1_i1:46-1161(+)